MTAPPECHPTGALCIESGAVSHVGCVRKANEDRFLVAPALGVYAVADGMGGHDSGALASATVVESLASIGPAVSAADLLARLEDRVWRANAALQEIVAKTGRILGSTVAILLVFDDHFACVWAGDSRIYRIRQKTIVQLSRDHTEVQDLVERGVLTRDEARTWPRRNVITRAVGVSPDLELELEHGEINIGDTFVICSDGLTGHVTDSEILAEARSDLSPQAVCDALLALTLGRGASDNVTIVVVRYGPGPATTDEKQDDRGVAGLATTLVAPRPAGESDAQKGSP